jgi:regulator of protease activity HflC (stomatin/prohibitin superfamily)
MSASLFEPTNDEGPAPTPPETAPTVAGSRNQQLVAAMRAGGKTSAWIFAFVLLVVIVLWQRVIYIVPAGGAGVMWQLCFGGTVTDRVYGEGIHIMFPWDRFTIYDTRSQAVDSDVTTLTAKGLPIELKLTIRYHPDYDTVALLDQRVGKDYVNKIVKPTIQSVLRRYIGRLEPEAVYTNKEGVLSTIVARAIQETSEHFVSIDDLIIREVSLPEALRDAIASKLVFQQQSEAYEFRIASETREKERKKIEAEGISQAQEIIRKGLTPELLRYEAIRVEGEIARSPNSKLIIMNSADSRQFNLNVP